MGLCLSHKHGRIGMCPQGSQSALGVNNTHIYGRVYISLELYDMDVISLLD